MKKCLIVLVLLAWGAVLFSGGTKTVYDFGRDTYYEFKWMLDSELHTWVGNSTYVDIEKDFFDYLFNNLIPRNEMIYRDLKNQLRNLESQITSKETEIKTKEKQIEELKSQITSKEAEINDLKGKLDKRDAEIKTLKDESSQLRSRFITAIVIGIVVVVVQFVVIFVLRRKTKAAT